MDSDGRISATSSLNKYKKAVKPSPRLTLGEKMRLLSRNSDAVPPNEAHIVTEPFASAEKIRKQNSVVTASEAAAA